MRAPIAWLMTAALLTSPVALTARELPNTPPPITGQKPFVMPASETYTLPNGMKVTLIPYGVAPTAYVSLRVATGTINQGRDTWLADMTLAMLSEGAAGMTATQLAQKAADMGGSISSSASTTSSEVATNILSEHAAHAIQLIADVAQRPNFAASDFERVKANFSRNRSIALSQASFQANAALARAYHGPDHTLGQTLPTEGQIAGYDVAKLKGWHAANFGAKRAHLYIAGRFDTAQVKAAAVKAFGGWAPGAAAQFVPVTPVAGPQVLLIDRPGAPQSTIRIAFPTVRAGDAMDIPTRVMNAVLGGSFSARIINNIREDKGYTYSPFSALTILPTHSDWTFEADVTTNVTGPALFEVFKEIKTLQQTPPGDVEADGKRQYLAGLFVIRNARSSALASTLATRDSLGLPHDWVERYVPSTLAVTNQQISDTAKQLPLDKMILVVVGDLKVITPQLHELSELKGMKFQTVTVP